MRTLVLAAIAAAVCAPMLTSSPAQAQATRTWVSGVGDDANPCSRTAPCKTFAGAISKTAALGEIDCLDPGGFGAVTITKSITIDCTGTFGSVLVSGTNGIVVAAAATDVVRIRGVEFLGLNTGLVGIFVSGAVGALEVENVNITEFKTGNASGIRFAPTNAGAKLFVKDSVIEDNGVGSTTGGGIVVVPNGGSANVQITNTRMMNNSVGLNMVSSGAISGAIQGGMIASNVGNGVTANQSPAALIVTFDGTSIVNNGATGLENTNGTVRIANTTISRNTTSLTGTVLSFHNNNVAGNNTDNLPALIAGAPM